MPFIADDALAVQHLERIRETAGEIGRDVTVMEVCGGHTNVIMRYGIRQLLPSNVKLISGPGCPVCVSSQHDIDCMIRLAQEGVPVATYGDMMRVPGSDGSLEGVKAAGGRVFEVYSATEALALAGEQRDLVFFGVGFETTAPMTSYLLEKGVSVYSVHKLVPPALATLVSSNSRIDGFIDPGHVSTIIGTRPYEIIPVPQAIAGFTAERVLRALRILLEMIRDGKKTVVNCYPEAVKEEGNPEAQKLLRKHFRVCDSDWRGLGRIPQSGFEVRDASLDAKVRYADVLEGVPKAKSTGCRCAEVLMGEIEPRECPFYKRSCTPEHPRGACMVSAEGSCAISVRYVR